MPTLSRHRRAQSLATLAAFALVASAAEPARAAGQKKPVATVQKTTTGGPQLAYERFRKKVQMDVAEKREDQIKGLKQLIELGQSPEELPSLKFRLAEAYSDKSRFFFFRGQEKDDEMIRASSEAEKASLEADKKQALEESKIWAQKAVEVYADIRQSHPEYNRMPEVLFALGQARWTRGEHDAALRPYADLIRQYPESPLVSEAWLAFGEVYFEKNDLMKALQSYEKAAENKRSRVYGFSLYKQGWCYYNLAEWKKALRKFEATVLFSQMSEEMSGENKIALGREAQADWVRTYVHTGTADRARFEIASLMDLDSCTGRCLKLLEGLAGLWYEEGYFDQAASVYRQLVRLEPESLRNPYRQGRVVDLADRMGDKKATVQASKQLVEVFKSAQARFEAMPEGQDKKNAAIDIDEASLVAETTLRRLAQEWNKEARKTRQDETFERAETMYADYLAIFPDAKQGYAMRFQYADLLYKLERFDAAATEYEKVVLAQPKEGEHLEEAANDNILALDEHLRDLRLELPENLNEPTPFHPQHDRLAKAIERYLTLVPADAAGEKRPAAELKLARLYYAYAHYDEALKRFDTIVVERPTSEQAVVAANLVVDIHNLKKDWQSLYDSATKYRNDAQLVEGRPKLAEELARFGEYAKFALVRKLQERVESERGDLRLVARAYEDFYAEFPRSENADEALFNASVLWDKAGDKARATELRQQLLTEQSDSPLRADVAYYVAKQHEERTEFAEAADAYASFAREFPDDERARTALYDASVLFAGTGRSRTAAKLREQYLDTFGKTKEGRADAEEMTYAIAADLERARRWSEAVRAYGDFAKKFAGTERAYDAMWNEAQIRRNHLRQRSPVEKLEGKLLGTVLWLRKKRREVPPNALRYASLIAFSRVEDKLEDYRRMRLRTLSLRNPTPFQKSLRDKARARDRVIAAYTDIIKDYQQAESSIASLHQIALASDIFQEAVSNLGCPRGIGEELCVELQGRLEEMALPALESAVAAYKRCVTESNRLSTFTDYSTRCAKRLETLAPNLAPPMVERVAAPPERMSVPTMDPNPLILRYDGYAVAEEAKAPAASATAAREVQP